MNAVTDEAVEAAAKARFQDTFDDPDDPQWDEIDTVERQGWLDVMRVALAAAVPLIREQWDAERMPLLHRIDGLLTLIYYRARAALTEQTQRDLDDLIREVTEITRTREATA